MNSNRLNKIYKVRMSLPLKANRFLYDFLESRQMLAAIHGVNEPGLLALPTTETLSVTNCIQNETATCDLFHDNSKSAFSVFELSSKAGDMQVASSEARRSNEPSTCRADSENSDEFECSRLVTLDNVHGKWKGGVFSLFDGDLTTHGYSLGNSYSRGDPDSGIPDKSNSEPDPRPSKDSALPNAQVGIARSAMSASPVSPVSPVLLMSVNGPSAGVAASELLPSDLQRDNYFGDRMGDMNLLSRSLVKTGLSDSFQSFSMIDETETREESQRFLAVSDVVRRTHSNDVSSALNQHNKSLHLGLLNKIASNRNVTLDGQSNHDKSIGAVRTAGPILELADRSQLANSDTGALPSLIKPSDLAGTNQVQANHGRKSTNRSSDLNAPMFFAVFLAKYRSRPETEDTQSVKEVRPSSAKS